jgi:glycosyltransferase involved in cell wall biosynthesis
MPMRDPTERWAQLITRKERNADVQQKKLIWVSYLFFDISLHKTSRIEILKHLALRGYTVYLIAVRSKNKSEPKESNIHIISIPLRYVPVITPLLFVGILLLLLPYYIVSLKPDFIVTDPNMSILGFIGAPIICRLKRIKLVLDVRSTPVEAIGFNGYLQTLFFDLSVFFAKALFDGMTVITAMMKKEICDKFGIGSKFPGVWTSGVAPDFFDPEKRSIEGKRLRREFGLADKLIVFYHGTFGVRRGLIECIKSIEILKNSNRDLALFLLGSGKALPEIEKTILAKGVQDRVIIHSPVDYRDVPSYIAMCDLGIIPLPDLPDWRNQCPLNLLEYLSMGKVVILTDIPAHREVLGESNCGIYVRSSDPTEIAGALKYALENQDKFKKFGSYGRELIKRKYTWNKVAEDFDRYLDTVKKGFNKE